MKRTSYNHKALPDTPGNVELDAGQVERFHRKLDEGVHAAFEYVQSQSEGDGWFERGVIDEVYTEDGVDRVTLRTLARAAEDAGEYYYTIYLDEDSEYGDAIPVYQRDFPTDTQPALSSEWPDPDERFGPDELPGCEQIGFLVRGGVLEEFEFHEAPPTEEFWSTPESLSVYTAWDEKSELSVGVTNRTGEDKPVSVTIDFPDEVEWDDGSSTGCGEYRESDELSDRRRFTSKVAVRSMRTQEESNVMRDVSVTLTLGDQEEQFEHVLTLYS